MMFKLYKISEILSFQLCGSRRYIPSFDSIFEIYFKLSFLQGVSELTPPIRRWIYLGTVFAPIAVPLLSYGMIVFGIFTLIYVFVRAYKNFVFTTDPAIGVGDSWIEMGRRSLRRSSQIIMNGPHTMMMHRDHYHLLRTSNSDNVITRHDG